MVQSKGKIIIWVMLITVLSKCFGFGRDIILAHFFGAGDITDAYFIAQTIPEFLFSLVVQTIGIGFIPVYIDIVHQESADNANRFALQTLLASWLLCTLLVVLINIFPRQIVMMFASKFTPAAANLAVSFVCISVLAMYFRISTAIISANLQANNHFIFPAAIGLPFDIIIIASIVIGFFTTPIVLAWGLVVAAALQVFFLLPQLAHYLSLSFRNLFPLFTPHLKKMCLLFFPVALGVSANQINILVDRTLASAVQGGISALNYANKTNNVLENIIILSLAMVMFPTFASYASKNDFESFITSVSKSLNVVIFTMFPCAVFFILFAPNIIQVLFGHGMFSTSSLMQTILVMRYYALGLLSLSCNVIFVRALYAVQKVSWVSVGACFSVTVNVLLNIILSRYMGLGGLALATSIANTFSACLLFCLLTYYLRTAFWRLFIGDLIKCGAMSCMMGVLSFCLYNWGILFASSLLACVTSVLVGGGIYLLGCILLRCDSLNYAKGIIAEIKIKILPVKTTNNLKGDVI